MANQGYIEECTYLEGEVKLTEFSPFNTLVVPLQENQLSLLNFLEPQSDPEILNKFYRKNLERSNET